MKNLLIVDDEETLIIIMKARFDDYKDQFSVFTARNGKEAVKILESTVIDFVVTDIKMQEMDGIELLAYMSAKFPHIPAIAISAFSTPEIEKTLEKMGTLRVLDKPMDLDMLANTVIKGLESSYDGGRISCVSVSSFFRLIEMEEKTCLLEVHGEGQKRGFLYFNQGEMYDATCGDLQGEPAAFEMIAWDNAQLYIKNFPKEKTQKRINKPIASIVMEGIRLKDEAAEAKMGESPEPDPVAEITDESVVYEFDEDSETVSTEEVPQVQEPGKIDGATQVELIEKIFKIINSKLRAGELFQAILNEFQSVVPFDLAIMLAKDDSRPGYLTVVDLMAGGKPTISRGASYPYQDSIIDTVLKQQTTLIVDDVRSLSSGVEKELFANQGLASCLLTPLMAGGVVTGILALAAKTPDIFYDVRGLIESITNGLSLVVERNRLSAEVVKQKQALDTTKEIGRALASSTFDIGKVLKYSMDMIRKIMDVEAGSLLLKVQNELKAVIVFNNKVESIKKFRLKIGEGIAGYVAEKGKSIIVNDTQKSSHFFSGIDNQTGFKTRSALCVPLISKEKVIGVIEVLNKINEDFDTGDEDLLQSIADSVSIAIESARLYKEADSIAEREQGIRRELLKSMFPMKFGNS